jgi:hypothetical protein
MTRILAIDPGPTRSAWLILEDGMPLWPAYDIEDNDSVLAAVRTGLWFPDVLVIEEVRSYGMPVGREVFDTVRWTGRFQEASPIPVAWLGRKEIVVHLCGSPRAKDPNVRQALLDRFGGKGTKADKGPLFGIAADLWSALAIAVTWYDRKDGT